MSEERYQKILRRLQALESQRSQWEALWREVSEYILPSRGFFSGQTPNQGEARQDRILDGTATRAVRVLAAGLQGGLTSPARPWFRLGLADRELMSFSPVREYLDECERRLYGAFSRSNFYSAIHAVYTELAGFGTAVLYEEQDPRRGLSFKVITAGEYCLAEGHSLVDTVYRRFWMTARQLVQRFGDRVSPRVKDAAAANPDEFCQVVHAVQPRTDRRPGKADKADMEWESVYLEFDRSEGFLQVGGYEEFPFMAPRWGASGADVYGRSPAHDALPDVKMLQDMQRSSLLALHKLVDPPLKAPAGFKGRLNMVPGGVTFYDGPLGEGLTPLYQIRPEVAAAEVKIERVQMAVREAFFNDLFLMILDRPNMTATEVAERHEEKLLLLGPVIERQFTELLDPCIDRTYAILNRLGVLPPPPPELQGRNLKIEYISLLAQAQKQAATGSIRAAADFVGALSRLVPEALDKLNVDEAIDQHAEAVGAPSRIIRSDEEVAEIRKLRAQAQADQAAREQQALEAQNALQAVEAAKKLSQSDLSRPNALTELLGLAGEAR